MSDSANHNNSSATENQQLSPPTMVNGNAYASLNVDAQEFRPSQELLNKLLVRNYRDLLRSHLMAISSSTSNDIENEFSQRLPILISSLSPVLDDKQIMDGIIDEIIFLCEDDASISTFAARLCNSLTEKFDEKSKLFNVSINEAIITRGAFWNSTDNGIIKEDQLTQALAFAHFVAAFYSLSNFHSKQLGCVLVALLSTLAQTSLVKDVTNDFMVGLTGLAEINMPAFLSDWVQSGESPDSHLDHLVDSLRELLVNGKAGPEAARSALSALEYRAEELSRIHVYAQCSSQHPSDMTDDVYTEYEKFLQETGQS